MRQRIVVREKFAYPPTSLAEGKEGGIRERNLPVVNVFIVPRLVTPIALVLIHGLLYLLILAFAFCLLSPSSFPALRFLLFPDHLLLLLFT
jgi:hypothetical protein